ncbi:hypothetical protein Q9L42_000030 (plasmid) [Methylomarinum sp. Ch1-1]|uniref:Uncharacterized protein n=1 Tax=Methylomarinum roseum TaxID=3067653 RepID=A0AAU7NNY6_9GAMM
MKAKTKTAAITALKWAAGLTAGFIIGPTIVILANGQGDTGGMIAEKLVVGAAWFPILFFGLWAWGTFSKKYTLENNPTSLPETNTNRRPSKWNHISILAGILMILFVFLPDMINGTLAGQYYLGIIFWIVVIVFCSRNILQARQ